jgi:hypothetical protein
MTTDKAALARVPGIYQMYRNTRQFRLVGQEGTQLRKRPIAVLGSLLFASNPSPLANMCQVFQRNSLLRVCGFGNDTLAQNVVRVFLKTALFARQAAQVTFGGQRATGLQSGTQCLLALSDALNRFAGMDLTVAISGNVRDAHVNAKPPFGIGGIWLVNVASLVDIKLALPENQVSFALRGRKQTALVFAHNKGDFQTTINRPDRDELLHRRPRQDTRIVRDASERPELTFRFLVFLVGISDFESCVLRYLRTQVKFFSYFMINPIAQGATPEDSFCPSNVAYVVASSIDLKHGLLQGLRLLYCRLKFYLGDQFHAHSIAQFQTFEKIRLLTVSISRLSAAFNSSHEFTHGVP